MKTVVNAVVVFCLGMLFAGLILRHKPATKISFAFKIKPGREYCVSGMNGEVVQVFPVVSGECDLNHPEDVMRIDARNGAR